MRCRLERKRMSMWRRLLARENSWRLLTYRRRRSTRAQQSAQPDLVLETPSRNLTLNDLPKTSRIWRASLRFSEMLRKIMAVCCGVWIASHDRLRAEGEVSDFSRSETPQALVWHLSCRRPPPV